MSKIIVPDEVLYSMICDNCHKYLSAKPVKVSKRQILCGRCVEHNNKEFVNSYYEVFAESALFKCINHFDGCNKLLAFDQVVDHEKSCKTVEYDCLLCPNNSPKQSVSTLQHHVKKQHIKSFLKKNCFTVDLIHLKLNTFFYCTENYMFFIQESFNNRDKTISLCAFGVGKYLQSLKVKVKYSIMLQDQKMMKLESVNWEAKVIKVINAKMNQVMTVNFDIEAPPQFAHLVRMYSQLSTKNDEDLSHSTYSQMSNKEENSINTTLNKLIENELSSVGKTGQIQCTWSRFLKFQSDNLKENNHVSISSCETKLIINTFVNCKLEIISVCFHCILCKCILKDITGNFVFKYGPLRHLVCKSCLVLVSQFCELVPLNSIISNEVFLSIQYSCIKRCRMYGFSFDNKRIRTHYESTLFSEKLCSMENCEFIATSVPSLVQHFHSSHNEELLFLTENFGIPIPLTKKCKKSYILQYDLIIEILLTFNSMHKKYCISAKICDNNEKLNLLMHVHKEKEGKWRYIGTFFEKELMLEATLDDELRVRCFVL